MKFNKSGFTVVELLVILVVLGILISATVAAYSDWRTRTAETEVKNDLKAAVAQLKNYRNFNNQYPSPGDFSTVFKTSEGVEITDMGEVVSGSGHCLVGTSKVDSSIVFAVSTDKNPEPVPGNNCNAL